jgi:hypothetical protein
MNTPLTAASPANPCGPAGHAVMVDNRNAQDLRDLHVISRGNLTSAFTQA